MTLFGDERNLLNKAIDNLGCQQVQDTEDQFVN
jgi:hypothetical protein